MTSDAVVSEHWARTQPQYRQDATLLLGEARDSNLIEA